MLRSVICLLFFGSSAVFAQTEEQLQIFADDLEACFFTSNTVELQRACIGNMAENCMEAEEGGYSTQGMSICSSAEAEVWDGLLNLEYQASMSWAKAMDEDDQKYFPEFAGRAQALREAQRAWIAFRDAECALGYAVWGAGSMRHIAGASCFMDMAAERTIELRAMREAFE